jgi:hypothetical protein
MDDIGDLDLKPLWLRRLAWDCLPCEEAPTVQAALGLVPVTEEGEELDHRASHQRMALVTHLSPAIEYFADLIGQVLSASLVAGQPEADTRQLTDELRAQFTTQNAEIIRIASLVVIAQLISTGVLGYTEKILG